MFKIPATLVFTLLAASAAADSSGAEERRITFTSYGAARIGMARAELEQVLGPVTDDYPGAGTEGCEYVTANHGYKGVSFMLVDQRLARIDVTNPEVMTLSGAHVGSSQATVMSLYPGRIRVTPHAYIAPDGSYLTLLSQDRKNGIRFETDHGKVTMYYAGTAAAIEYIEGCM